MERWVFGLSIDEEISWGAARLNADYELEKDTLKIGPLLSRNEANGKIKLEQVLRHLLLELAKTIPLTDVFSRTVAVGVSSMGLIDRKLLRLTSIARKNWSEEINEFGEKNCVVDFGRLFDGLFPEMKPIAMTNINILGKPINIHNDATAKCIAEYYNQSPDDKAETLFGMLISEGINGGLVIDGWPATTELHPEIGHIWPRLHPADYKFDKTKSGCPIHKDCYEGLASGARIRNSWGRKSLAALGKDYDPNDRDHPWHIIAYYIAQLCMAATLAVSPERIVINGPIVFPRLLPHIRKYFGYFNSGGSRNPDGSPRNYLKYEKMGIGDGEKGHEDYKDFIQITKIQENDGILGALELGRLATGPNAARALLLSARHRGGQRLRLLP